MTDKITITVDSAVEGVASARIGGENHRTEVALPGGRSVIADKPVEDGGAGDDPGPVDLMVAALVACKAFTLRSQALRHGWPMTGATVTAKHQRIAARKLDEGARGIVDLVDCEVHIEGDELTEEQRRRLYELCDTCWVQHALETETRISSRLVE